MLYFVNDYSAGAHPKVFKALEACNKGPIPGYSMDSLCEAAECLIRQKAECPNAKVYFISGGTQTNLIAISSILKPWEAVIAADTGHINTHEAGAIEATGHKVLTRPCAQGKLTPEAILDIVNAHTNEHMVKPAMVYISQTTELGTHYTLAELEAISRMCREKGLLLYVDGARLASALACSDVTLADLARCADIFYIGGTKCGALFGEALVYTRPDLVPDMRYYLKTRGALFAKGWLMGAQLEALMAGSLYTDIGKHENQCADIIRKGLAKRGVQFYSDSVSNQIFPILSNDVIDRLEEGAEFLREYPLDNNECAIRLVMGWATKEEDCRAFLALYDDVVGCQGVK